MRLRNIQTSSSMALIQRMSQVYLRRNQDILDAVTLDDPSQLWMLIREHKLQAIVQHLNKDFDLDILVPSKRRLQRRSKKMILSKLFQLKELISCLLYTSPSPRD